MRMKTSLVVAAATALIATPVVAHAARSTAPVSGESDITAAGGVTQLIVLAVIVGAIVAGIELTDDEPSSP